MRRYIFLMVFSLSVVNVLSPVNFLSLANAQSFCDPELQTQESDPNAYQERDGSKINRCEGIYLQDVASSAASVTSFTTSYESLAETLYLSWENPNADNLPLTETGQVRVRAESQVFKLYYRMDTVWQQDSDDFVNDGETSSFVWSTEIVKELKLENPQELGVTAWLPATFSDGVERDVYLPLSVTTENMPLISNRYTVTVMPSAELRAVSYQVFKTNDGYATEDTMIVVDESRDLNNDYFSSGQPLEIEFALTGDPGVYYLEIEATRTNQKKSTLEVWFYHHGN